MFNSVENTNSTGVLPIHIQYVTNDYSADSDQRITIAFKDDEIKETETIINPEIISKALASFLDKSIGEKFAENLLTVWEKLSLIEKGNVLFEHLINKTKVWWLKHHCAYITEISETWKNLASTEDLSKVQNIIEACLAQPGKLWFMLLNALAPFKYDACHEPGLIEIIQKASHTDDKKFEYKSAVSVYSKVISNIKQPLSLDEAGACYRFGKIFSDHFKETVEPSRRLNIVQVFSGYSLLLRNRACFDLLLKQKSIFSKENTLIQILEVDIPDSEKRDILSVALPDKKMLTDKDPAGLAQRKVDAQIKKCLSILNTFKNFSLTKAGSTLFQKMFDVTKKKGHLDYVPLTTWEPNKLESLFEAILAEPEEIWLKFIQVLKKYPAEELVEKQNMFVAAMVQTKEAKLDEKERVDFFQFYLMASKERADLDVNCLRSYYNYAKKLGYPIESKSLAILIANQIYLPILCELRDKFSYSSNLLRDVLQALPCMLDENRPQDRWKDLLPVFVDFYNRKRRNIKLLDFSSHVQPHLIIQAIVHDFFICENKDSPWKWTEEDKTAAIEQCVEECVEKSATLITDEDTISSEAYRQIRHIARELLPLRRECTESMCEGKYLVDHLQTLLTTYRNESNWTRSLSRNSELRKLEEILISFKENRPGFASTCFDLLLHIRNHKLEAIEKDNKINKWRPFWHKHNQKGYSRYLNTLDKMRDYLVSELVKNKENIVTLPHYMMFRDNPFREKKAFFEAIADYLSETKGFSLSTLFCDKAQRKAVSNFYQNYENKNESLLSAINVIEKDLPSHIKLLARDLKFQLEVCDEVIPPRPES